MNLETLFPILGLLIYLGIIGLVVWRILTSSDEVKNERSTIAGLSLGTSRFGTLSIAAMLAITMLGPADALALSENGLNFGAIWFIFPLGAALALFVSGRFIVERVHNKGIGSATVGDLFANAYGDFARFIVGVVVTVQTIAFAGVLIIAGGQLLNSFMGLDPTLGMVITAVVVGVYTSFAGMDGVTATDRIQSKIVLVIFGLIFVTTILLLFRADMSSIDVWQKDAFATEYPVKIIIAYFAAYFLGELMLPTYTQRALISDSAKSARNGFMLGSVFLVAWYFIISLSGSLAEATPISADPGSGQIVIIEVGRFFFPEGSVLWGLAGAVVFAGLLALIHSTYDSFLQVGSTSFAKDVVGSFVADSDNLYAWVAKQSAVAISVFGLLMGIWFDNIVDALIFGYTIWVPSLLPPFLFLIFSDRPKLSPLAFLMAFVSGTSVWIITEFFVQLSGWMSFVPSIVLGLLVNFVVLFAGHSVLRNGNSEVTN